MGKLNEETADYIYDACAVFEPGVNPLQTFDSHKWCGREASKPDAGGTHVAAGWCTDNI
jgi:hypothetical protein